MDADTKRASSGVRCLGRVPKGGWVAEQSAVLSSQQAAAKPTDQRRFLTGWADQCDPVWFIDLDETLVSIRPGAATSSTVGLTCGTFRPTVRFRRGKLYPAIPPGRWDGSGWTQRYCHPASETSPAPPRRTTRGDTRSVYTARNQRRPLTSCRRRAGFSTTSNPADP